MRRFYTGFYAVYSGCKLKTAGRQFDFTHFTDFTDILCRGTCPRATLLPPLCSYSMYLQREPVKSVKSVKSPRRLAVGGCKIAGGLRKLACKIGGVAGANS